MQEQKKWMRIGELSRLSGVPKSTIHYYVREKVLPEPLKTGRTMAYYDKTHLERLIHIERMKREMGLPLSFIQKQAGLLSSHVLKGQSPSLSIGDSSHEPRDQRRQEIAKASIEVFSRKGFHETRVSDVTGALGISTGTFYLYFRNKRELFVEVVDEVVRAIVGESAREIKGEPNLWKRMVIRSRAFFENFEKYNEILHQLRVEMTHGGWPEGKIEEVFKKITRPLVEEIEESIRKGVIREVDAELLAFAAIGMIEGLTLRSTFDDNYSFNSLVTFIGDAIFYGLAPKV